ncbi:hypothetical protein NT6N_21490 [Oceaniferula spumae]|uniref:FecR protein domain-containing protein n=1 Tax=Oceaniferula spumae TaxID=2979115 RepID=A0AAT9FMC1_9BACT
MNRETRKELSSLLSAVVDGYIDEAGGKRLNELLDNNPQAQAYYHHYIAVHCHLEDLQEKQDTSTLAKPQAGSKVNYWLAAAACLAMFCGLWFFAKSLNGPTQSNVVSQPKLHTSGKIIAVIGNAEDAEWDIENLRPIQGTALGEGLVHLTQGRIRLDFPAGEKVTIAAPALFNIKDNNLLQLQKGELFASVPEAGRGFTVIMPNGAVVDLGTEFAIKVQENGENYVKVIKGLVVASSTNSKGNTTWEETLNIGDEVSVQRETPLERKTAQHKYIDPLPDVIPALTLSPDYRESVKKSRPISYWEFDSATPEGMVTDTVGNNPMQLGLNAVIHTSEYGGHLRLDHDQNQGYAKAQNSIAGVNTDSGFSLEMWAYSNLVDWQSLALVSPDAPLPPEAAKRNLKHAPQIILLERAGRSGSSRHHIHPDFALRSVYRSPAAYGGGANIYTENSHLIHKWQHIVIVRNQDAFQTYVNGKLAAEERIHFKSDESNYDLLLGRLHTFAKQGDARQWSGAIDEVSLYDRSLTPAEVLEHYRASNAENK